jgi:DNA-binding NarL/FixJ family response regulator
MTKVMLADDHAMVRDGLRRLLETEPGFEISSQATTGLEVLQKLEQEACDLLLLDLTMPAPNGPKLIGKIRSKYPTLPLLVVTMHNEPRMAQAALQAGANGYITKDAEPTELLEAVRRVAAGSRYVSPEVLEGIAFLPTSGSEISLSAREQEVLRRLVAGQTNNQIAHDLFISEKTVSSHKANLMAKLGASSLADLIRLADSLGPLASREPGDSENSD